MALVIFNIGPILAESMTSEQRDALAKNLIGPIGEVMTPSSASSEETSSNEVSCKKPGDALCWIGHNTSNQDTMN